jgi:hypothetical protein
LRLASASITLASMAKPSPPTRPAANENADMLRLHATALGGGCGIRFGIDGRLAAAVGDRATCSDLDHEHQARGYFTRADFVFDKETNDFICPGGKQLTNNGLVREDGTMPYRASAKDCRACTLKARRTTGPNAS